MRSATFALEPKVHTKGLLGFVTRLRATAFTPMKIKTLGEMWLTGRKLVGPLVTLENSAL